MAHAISGRCRPTLLLRVGRVIHLPAGFNQTVSSCFIQYFPSKRKRHDIKKTQLNQLSVAKQKLDRQYEQMMRRQIRDVTRSIK